MCFLDENSLLTPVSVDDHRPLRHRLRRPEPRGRGAGNTRRHSQGRDHRRRSTVLVLLGRQRPFPPVVKNIEHVQSPLDRFVLAAQEAKNWFWWGWWIVGRFSADATFDPDRIAADAEEVERFSCRTRSAAAFSPEQSIDCWRRPLMAKRWGTALAGRGPAMPIRSRRNSRLIPSVKPYLYRRLCHRCLQP